MKHVQKGEKEAGREDADTEVVRTFDQEFMRCEARILNTGVRCGRVYRRIEDDYDEVLTFK